MRKLWPFVGTLCATVFGSLFAHNGEVREITPNAGPCISNGAGVFITANFIWWKATQDTLSYAISGVASPANIGQRIVSATGITGQGRVNDPSFGWDPGFKIGLGYNLDHDGWSLYAQYTWLYNSSSDTTTGISITNSVQSVTSGLGNFLPLGDVVKRRSWDLHFNVIDLELGRNFYVSRSLMLKPHFGLKATWQEQEIRSKISSVSQFSALQGVFPGPFRSRQDHDTWGLGIRAGLSTAWHFTTNWSIFGNVAWSTMWTHYDVTREDKFILSTNPESLYTFVNTEMNNYRVRYVGELELGLRFETWFYNDRYHFAVQAGWEEQVWVNYGNFIKLYNDIQGDLTLHGLNLKFRFDF